MFNFFLEVNYRMWHLPIIHIDFLFHLFQSARGGRSERKLITTLNYLSIMTHFNVDSIGVLFILDCTAVKHR